MPIRGEDGQSVHKLVLDKSVAAVALSDAQGTITYVNDAFVELWGAAGAEECIGRSVLEFWDRPESAGAVVEALARDGEWTGTLVARRMDGTLRTVQVSAGALVVGGEAAGMMATFIDLTRTLRAESRLETEASRAEALFQHASVGIAEVRRPYRIARANQALADMVGLPLEEIEGRTVDEVSSDPGRDRAVIDALFAGERDPIQFLREGERPTGRPYCLEVRVTPAIRSDGSIPQLVVVVRDITAEREARRALERSEARFRAIAEHVESAFWLARPDYSEVLYASPAFERIWGISPEEVAHNPEAWRSQVHPEDLEWVAQAALLSPTRYAHRHRVVDRDGLLRWVDVRVVPADLEERLIVGVANDVTDQVLAEQEREQVGRELAASAAENRVLLREVHHRVKNNLQVVSSLLSLAEGTAPDGARGVLADSRDRVLAMATVHEALYATGRFDAVDLSEYVPRLVGQLVAAWGRAAQIEVSVDVGSVRLSVDRAVPCGLILNELVTNALKHAYLDRPGQGSLAVEVRREGQGICLQVSDDGPGMPEKLREDALGLTITRALVDQLEGELSIDSDGGMVATVCFSA